MQVLRRRASALVGGWLACQLSLLLLAPAVLCADASSASAALESCTCGHGDGQTCPMHHPNTTSRSTCSCARTSDVAGAAVVALLGPAAVVPPAASAAEPSSRKSAVHASSSSTLTRPALPDSPPPRSIV